MKFTLVELLVVVAVIAILMAVLLPALMRAKDKARQIKCMGNMRQLGVTFQMYFNDYGYFPQTLDGSNRWWFRYEVGPYINSTDGNWSPILFCPSAQTANVPDDYCMNMRMNGRNPATLAQPAAAVLLVDGTGSQFWDVSRWVYRHNGGLNALFADGHVKWCRCGEISDISIGY